MSVHVDFPWRYDARGATARTDDDGHVADMLELLLLTEPGERVNRPDFGCGLAQLVFAPNSPELAAAVRFTMQAAIERELGDVLALQALEVLSDDVVLRVAVTYVVLASGTERTLVVDQVGAP